MSDTNFMKFLGTAGSRWVVARQLRASGGIYLQLNGTRIYLDPGPGALVRCAQCDPPIDPARLQAVILTHSHIDHCNDVNIMIDAMTGGGYNRGGTLFAPVSCLEGEHAVVLRYLRPFLHSIVTLEPDKRYMVERVAFHTSKPHDHGVDTFGITFDLNPQRLSFLVDTRYFKELPSFYEGADILVVYVTFFEQPPHPGIMHLGLDDVRAIAREVRPRQIILTHFGLSMLEAGPSRVAEALTDELGLSVIAADDGLVVPLV
ncbi:MAG: MBL fold metallo-hydrolase [Candidatus Hydrogenedentes bacterium]|nr:MBL fold metallo-hydrolase [Candidatus Hydrogenedentota bacterium]